MKRRTEDSFDEELDEWDDWDENDSPQRGGALFDFNLQPTSPPRNWRNVLDRQRFQARLRANRDVTTTDNLGAEVVAALRRSIQSQINQASLQPHHLVHFTMQSRAFHHAFQSARFTVEEFTSGSMRLDTYLNSLADKLNSNEEFQAEDDFTVETTFVRTPGTGSGNGNKNKPGKHAIEKLLANKRSVITVKNKDDLCCARALVTMKCLADEGNRSADYDSLKRGRPIQTRLAKELHRQAGVPEGPCGIQELQKFQEILPEYQIKVLSVDTPHCIIFNGPEADKKILLIKVDDHYHGCNSFGGFLSKSYYCHDCDYAYDHDDPSHHRCKGKWCPSCDRNNCADYLKLTKEEKKKPKEYCSRCNRLFYGDECHASHLQGTKTKRSLCDTKKKCLACKRVHAYLDPDKSSNKKEKHKCGWDLCNFCTKKVELAKHKCYVQPIKASDDEPKLKKISLSEVNGREIIAVSEEDEDKVWVEKPKPVIVYADYEATTDEEGVQSPILICAESEEDDETVPFYGDDCTEHFMNYLEDLTIDEHGEQRKVICVFHNFKGYDGMFVLKYLYDTHRSVENQICIGTKVLSLSTGDITFKDSLCFLAFPLSQFPSTFGIKEMKKGFFPHKFNTVENQSYEGSIPPPEYYDPEGMNPKMKKEFEKWHSEKQEEEYLFNLKEEMQDYCTSDVKLLKAGCQKFQEQFKEKAEFDPIEKCVTIASACNRYWRKMLLPKNTIAVEPPSGWHGATTNQSIKALKWLTWKEHRLQKSQGTPADRIRHSYNGGEVMVFTPAQSYRVDGFDELTNDVYEFHGCLWHGCPRCFPNRNDQIYSSDRTFQERYEATKAKEETLSQQGYNLFVIWECEWDRLVKSDDELKAFLATIEITEPLNPREAFFGGRTNAITLYSKIDKSKGEQIRYIDVTSLYPWVNKYAEYPLGHPEIITNPENQDIASYFGIAKVTILPPFELFHPVLPYRCKGKLVFPLCKCCAENEMRKNFAERSETCKHSSEERAITGTWCTPEIVQAVEMGYEIQTIHEVWNFKNKQAGLFSKYVNTWLQIKQESAGYPGDVQTEEEKKHFVESYKEHENIDLDPDQIKKNPGRKATAKLMLNSFWGKFGENLNKPSTQSITTPSALFSCVTDPLLEIHQIRICNEELLEVVYSNAKCNQLDNGKRNVFVAAFTTCHARLKLYSYLQKLDKQVLYFDTDSVVYKWSPGEPEIPLGDFLGEMTDELEDSQRPGDYIAEFVSGGPKNYGYVTDQGAVCCKVRGFSLKSVRGSSQLNYSILRDNLLNELTDPQSQRRNVQVVNPNFFTRDPCTKRIKVIPRNKLYGLVFDKRVVDFKTFSSFPYGYRNNLEQEDIEMAELLCEL